MHNYEVGFFDATDQDLFVRNIDAELSLDGVVDFDGESDVRPAYESVRTCLKGLYLRRL